MSIDRWIKDMVLLVIKKNEMMPFAATWMGPEIIMLSEVSQRNTDIIWYHLYVKSKRVYMNLLAK